ncbi:hypothetical protein ACFX2F_028899 [Malus domestica]
MTGFHPDSQHLRHAVRSGSPRFHPDSQHHAVRSGSPGFHPDSQRHAVQIHTSLGFKPTGFEQNLADGFRTDGFRSHLHSVQRVPNAERNNQHVPSSAYQTYTEPSSRPVPFRFVLSRPVPSAYQTLPY